MYSPLCGLTSNYCGDPLPLAEAFIALRAKKELFMLFWHISGHFWCSVIISVKKKSQNWILSNLKLENLFFLIWNLLRRKHIKQTKKCYSPSFPILGLRDLTRALLSTPFRIQGGYPECDRLSSKSEGQKSLCLIEDCTHFFFTISWSNRWHDRHAKGILYKNFFLVYQLSNI